MCKICPSDGVRLEMLTNTGLQGSTLSDPCMTTDFGPFELMTHGLLQPMRLQFEMPNPNSWLRGRKYTRFHEIVAPWPIFQQLGTIDTMNLGAPSVPITLTGKIAPSHHTGR